MSKTSEWKGNIDAALTRLKTLEKAIQLKNTKLAAMLAQAKMTGKKSYQDAATEFKSEISEMQRECTDLRATVDGLSSLGNQVKASDRQIKQLSLKLRELDANFLKMLFNKFVLLQKIQKLDSELNNIRNLKESLKSDAMGLGENFTLPSENLDFSFFNFTIEKDFFVGALTLEEAILKIEETIKKR